MKHDETWWNMIMNPGMLRYPIVWDIAIFDEAIVRTWVWDYGTSCVCPCLCQGSMLPGQLRALRTRMQQVTGNGDDTMWSGTEDGWCPIEIPPFERIFRRDRINWEKQYKGDCNELGWIGIPRLVQSWSSGVHMWSLKMARLTETGWSYPRASTLSTVMRNCAAPWPPFLRCFCATRRQHRVPYGQTKWV